MEKERERESASDGLWRPERLAARDFELGERRFYDIEKTYIRDYRDGEKVVLIVEEGGASKEFILNRINTKQLIDAFGERIGGWRGRRVCVECRKVPFRGKFTKGLRIWA